MVRDVVGNRRGGWNELENLKVAGGENNDV